MHHCLISPNEFRQGTTFYIYIFIEYFLQSDFYFGHFAVVLFWFYLLPCYP